MKRIMAILVMIVGAAVFAGPSELEKFLAPTLSSAESLQLTLSAENLKSRSFSYWRESLDYASLTNALANGRPVVVTLSPGTYLVPSGHVSFRGVDSGTPAAPLTFRAERPGTVKIAGVDRLSPSSFRAVSASKDAQYDRLPEAARSSIRTISLPSGINLHDKSHKPGIESQASVSAAVSEMLFLDGRLQPLARWPNLDRTNSVCWAEFASVDQVPTKSDPGAPLAVTLPDSRAARWKDLTALTNSVMFRVTLPYCWHDEYAAAATYNPSTRQLTFAHKMDHAAEVKLGTQSQAQRFVAVNVLEELDAPGEWWVDHARRVLYYYPPADFSEASELVLVSYKSKLLNVEAEAHDIRFENLEFAYSGSIGEFAAGSTRLTFAGCTFHSFTDKTTLKGTEYCFRDCAFHDFEQPVLMDYGGELQTLTSSRTLFERCSFARFQQSYLSHWGALAFYEGSGTAVRGCTFCDGPHTGISAFSNNHFFGWNRFSDLMHETIDSGIVYTGHTTYYLGNLIVGCTMTGSRPTTTLGIPPGDSRSFAVYFDDGVWGGDVIGCDIDGMVNSVFLRGGNLHRVMWNRVTNSEQGFSIDRCLAFRSDAFINGFEWTDYNNATGDNWFTSYYEGRNAKKPIDRQSRLWRASFPLLNETIEDPLFRIEPWQNRWEGNLYDIVGKPWSDKSYEDSSRRMTYRNNVFGRTTQPFVPHEGFASLARAVRPNDVDGYAAARTRLAALSNAAPVRVVSPGGRLVVRFGYDAIARLSCRAELDGRDMIAPSPMGLTVNNENYGRLVLLESPQTDIAEGGRATRLRAKVVSVVDGPTDIALEALVRDTGFAYRFVNAGGGEWNVVGEGYEWNRAPGVPASAVFCSQVETDAGVFAHGYRTPWRACRLGGSKVVQVPELAAERLVCDGRPHKLSVSDDTSALIVSYAASNDYVSPGMCKITVTPRVGYAWSDGTAGAKTLSYVIEPAPDGWQCVEGRFVYMQRGVARWRLEVADSGLGDCQIVSCADSVPTDDGVLDLWGLDERRARNGLPVSPSVQLSFAEGSGLSVFSSVKALVVTNARAAVSFACGALKPFAGVSSLVLGSAGTDLTVGSKSKDSDWCSETYNVFAAVAPALTTVWLRGRNVTLRDAFCHQTKKAVMRDLLLVAEGDLDLGACSFNFNLDSTGSLTNVLLSAKGNILMGSRTFRGAITKNAQITVRAAPTSTVTFNGESCFEMYSGTSMPTVFWRAPLPRVSGSNPFGSIGPTFNFDTDYVSCYGAMKGPSAYVTLPGGTSTAQLALPTAAAVLAGGALPDGGWRILSATDPSVALRSGVARWMTFDEPAFPVNPTVNGESVEPQRVFEVATSTKPITYPSAPTLAGGIGRQTITFDGTTVNVPEYYTATLAGSTVSLALNANAIPTIADGVDGTKSFVVTDTTVAIHLEHTYGALSYALATAERPDGPWTTGAFEKGRTDFTLPRDTSAAACFCKIVVRD